MRRPGFIGPILLALWIVGSAPFLGRLTRWIQEEVDRSLLVIVPTILFWAAAAAFVVWIVRSSRRLRWSNYAALAAGALWAVVQATALARGRPEESALERMHLVLYGLVALLLYRAFLQGGRTAIAAAFSAAALTSLLGLADEFIQWLVWVRAGDFYDCLLNASAAGCGVVFGAGPVRIRHPAARSRGTPDDRRAVDRPRRCVGRPRRPDEPRPPNRRPGTRQPSAATTAPSASSV